MNRTVFIACNLVRTENGKHWLIGTGQNGEFLFNFELSKTIAEELSDKMSLQISNVQKTKTWQEDQEEGAEVSAVALQ